MSEPYAQNLPTPSPAQPVERRRGGALAPLTPELAPDALTWRADFAAAARDALGGVDLLAPLAEAAATFAASAAWPTVAELAAFATQRGLVNAAGLPLRLVETPPKPRRKRRLRPGETPPLGYEERIYATGEVPTRASSWHDFLNLLVWAAFPRTKAALNERQIRTAATPSARERREGRVRTREQNRLAMLDEGGVLLVRGRVVVIGHALYETAIVAPSQLVAGIWALPIAVPDEAATTREAIDAYVASVVASGVLADEATWPRVDVLTGRAGEGAPRRDVEPPAR